MTALIIFLFLFAILYDCMTVLKAVGTWEKVIYFFFMAVSFSVLILFSLDIILPSPAGAITKALDAMFHIKQ